MKIGVKNQYHGEIVLIKKGLVNGEVVIRIQGGEYIASIMTSESIERLNLKEGNSAWALIKASSVVMVVSNTQIRASARNEFFGRVTDCREGVINGQVTLVSEGNNSITAVVTKESISRLGLRTGINASALVKASSVRIGVEH